MRVNGRSGSRLVATVVFVVLGAAGRPAESSTTICGERPPVLSYRYTFLGIVLSSRKAAPSERGTRSYVIEPVRVWKGGWPGDATKFRLTADHDEMGRWMVEGAYYVVVASAEPQRIGECDHEPVPLANASQILDQLDTRPASLKLPKRAFLSPSQLRCPPTPADASIDRFVESAELIVLGRLPKPVASGYLDDMIDARLEVGRTLKGRSGGPVVVRITRALATRGTKEDSLWFLGARQANGRRRVLSLPPLGDQRQVLSRIERWQVLGGRECAESKRAVLEQ